MNQAENQVSSLRLQASLAAGVTPKTLGNLTGEYPSQTKKVEVAQALEFWKFVRNELPDHVKASNTKSERHQVLLEFRQHRNQLVSLVAHLELIPTTVLRQLLWDANIDFQSMESFLRRVTSTQVAAIKGVCAELFDQQTVPKFLTESWTRRVRNRLYHVPTSFETLMDERYEDTDKRYREASALAYNLAYLDFGWSKYEDDNTESVPLQRGVRQFLKPTTDQTSFTVNQESGRYWWLYKTIRSNYLFNSDKAIQLKFAICPGFWYTLIMWLLLLVVSPLASAVFAAGGHHAPWQISVPLGIVGAISPAIAATVLAKYVATTLAELFVQHVRAADLRYWKSVGEVMMLMAIGGVLCALTVLAWMSMYTWWYESWFLASWCTAFVFLYVTLMFHKEKFCLPTSVPIIGIPTVVVMLCKAAFDTRETWYALLQFFAANATYIGGFILFTGMYLSVLAMTMHRSNLATVKRDEQSLDLAVRGWRIMEATYQITFIIIIGGIAYFFAAHEHVSVSQGLPLLPLVIWGLIFFAVFRKFADPQIEENALLTAKRKVLSRYNLQFITEYGLGEVIKKNAFLRKQHDPVAVLRGLDTFFAVVQPTILREHYWTTLQQCSLKTMQNLPAYTEYARHNQMSEGLLRALIDGEDLQSALSSVNRAHTQPRKEELRRLAVQRLEMFLEEVITRILRVTEPLRKIYHDLLYTWEAFQEKCPHVKRPRNF